MEYAHLLGDYPWPIFLELCQGSWLSVQSEEEAPVTRPQESVWILCLCVWEHMEAKEEVWLSFLWQLTLVFEAGFLTGPMFIK